MRKIIELSLLSLLLVGCASDEDKMPEVIQVKKITPYHKVSGEDTVESVAKQYNMTRAELIKLNNLEPPYNLYEGQRLIIKPKVSSDENNENQAQDTDTKSLDATETTSEAKQNELDTIITNDYEWPIANCKNRISQHFDGEGGIIIDASVGTPVKSIADGNVVISGIPSGEAAAYGITVVIKHSSKKTMSIYSNLKEANVNVGQKIKKGTIIGKVGKTGSIATKPQLYFEINELANGSRHAVDPEKIIME